MSTGDALAAIEAETPPLFDPTAPLRASGNLRRRNAVSRLAAGGAQAAAILAILVLGAVVLAVVNRGGNALSWHFITQSPTVTGVGGGIAPEIVGTLLICALAVIIAAPLGVLVALYVTEFAGARLAVFMRTVLDLMQGLPSIIIGLLFFGLLVAGSGQSGYAASLALATIMLPLVARSTQEVILLVPRTLREGADALGVPRWRTVVGIILPEAIGGIVTGTLLAFGRAAGETAPIIALNSVWDPAKFVLNPFVHRGIPNLPFYIFNQNEQGDPASVQRAWGAALVLLIMILLANFTARALLARNRRKFAR
ncbi:MAG TPA: phosphate ABC transporter permease PstA [Solirubrobacteraceae bacterium]|nr:phosphate ABC transporter permease PstA [Solirubrobacteraceae bacterium]